MILQRKKLGEIIKLEYGKPLPESERKLRGSYPVYGANGIKSYSDLSYVNHRSIIVGRKGSAGEVNLTEEKFWPLDVTYFVTYDEKKYDLGFLYRLLSSINLPKLAKGVKPGLNRNDVYSISVEIPRLIDDQKKISQVIDAVDTLRSKRRQAIELLDDYLKSAFLKMFGDPVKNPKRWKTERLNDVCDRLSDGPFGSKLKTEHYVDNGIRVIRLQNIGINKFKDNDKAFISETYYNSDLSKYTCKAGEIVIATLGDPNIRACLIPDYIHLSVNKADCIHCIPDNESVNSEYLLSLLNLPQFHHSFTSLTHGETRTRVSSGQLKNIQIPLPKMELQNKFAEVVVKSKETKQKMLSQSEELENQFQALMQKAFKGEL
ncbi:MAG TPA: restriction endonuclease subunit S [Syntrophorhabdaceae bacterium]|nr:restriction endonuclease subunit S [Syntrophorhabdaceae bacterium]